MTDRLDRARRLAFAPITIITLLAACSYPAQAETVQSVEQLSYDSVGRVQCTALRMNPASFAALPADACTLGTQGAQGADRITMNLFDPVGQLLQIRRAVGTSLEQAYVTYSYTNNGKRAQVIDANGNRAQVVYDGFDRQTKWIFPSPTQLTAFNPATPATALSTAGAVNPSDYEQYAYDVNGNRTSLRKRDGSTITFTYDALNRVTIKTVPERSGLAVTHTRDVYYGYDLRGLQLFTRFDSITGEGITTTYDGLGRMSSSTTAMDSANRTISYQYDADGDRTRVTHPDGNFVTYSYDGLDRPLTIARAGAATVASYTYDAAGRRIAFNGGVSTSYSYDAAGRLATLTNNLLASTYNNQWSFTFTPSGQIASNTRTNDTFAWTGAVNVTRAYSANGLNLYTAAGPAAFCYDANGNLTADGSNVYLYDVENRLVEKRTQGSGNSNCAALAYTGTLQAGLRYDPMGRLYEVGGASGTTRMLYDGDALTAEYDTSGNLLRRYVHGADMKADDPIAWYEGGGFSGANERILRSDWQGSIVLVTDSVGGTVLAVNRYDEYGIPQSTNAGRFQYTGQAWLAELGMYYYKARIYSPTLGRFLQADPIGYKDQVNLYTYSENDPLNTLDFTGLDSYEVGRPLQGVLSVVGDHMFIVTDARYPGDPDPNVRFFSFGKLENGNMGNVSSNGSKPDALSARTATADRKAWLSLASPSTNAAYSRIDAPDNVVAAVASAVKENKPYAAIPDGNAPYGTGTNEVNSNSAATAVADKATYISGGKNTPNPTWFLTPGASKSGRVEFGPIYACGASGTQLCK